MNGKGSKPRPLSISKEEFHKNFDRIFAPKKEVCEGCGEDLPEGCRGTFCDMKPPETPS
jgi:hypothetical protein